MVTPATSFCPRARPCAPARPTAIISKPSALSLKPATSSAAKEAEAVAEKLEGQTFAIIRQAGETGVLYGSVATRDIAEVVTENGFSVSRNQIELNQAIKNLGVHAVKVQLHPEVRDHHQHECCPLSRGSRAPGAW